MTLISPVLFKLLKRNVEESLLIENYNYSEYKQHWYLVKDCFYGSSDWKTTSTLNHLKRHSIPLLDFILFFEKLLKAHEIGFPIKGKSANEKFLKNLKKKTKLSIQLKDSSKESREQLLHELKVLITKYTYLEDETVVELLHNYVKLSISKNHLAKTYRKI